MKSVLKVQVLNFNGATTALIRIRFGRDRLLHSSIVLPSASERLGKTGYHRERESAVRVYI